jgi:hypothetical protein
MQIIKLPYYDVTNIKNCFAAAQPSAKLTWINSKNFTWHMYVGHRICDVIIGWFNYLHLSINWRFKQKHYYQRWLWSPLRQKILEIVLKVAWFLYFIINNIILSLSVQTNNALLTKNKINKLTKFSCLFYEISSIKLWYKQIINIPSNNAESLNNEFNNNRLLMLLLLNNN